MSTPKEKRRNALVKRAYPRPYPRWDFTEIKNFAFIVSMELEVTSERSLDGQFSDSPPCPC